jgi:hypothetical protein
MFQFRRNRKLLAMGLILMILGQGIAVAQVVWVKSLDEAVKQAAREKKTIILDVSESW